ncbi:MAG: segregation/condensation protein A [Synechococcales bacterium]|nr:segregation/condensation protein A [Synechococcales bacterium]
MAHSLAQNAIALLIDLAERGEIDPWDVKVIDVVDRFLSQLQPGRKAEGGRSPYEADLSESGQAFLYASMLVLLKADSLARSEEPEEAEEDLTGVELLVSDSDDAPLPLNLEKKIRRRAVARPPQNRRVTLQELIQQLEVIATAMADHKPRARTHRPRPQAKSKAIRAIAQLAHQENLSEIAAALDQLLSQYWEGISGDGDWVDFEYLLEVWTTPKIQKQFGLDKLQSAHHTPQSDRVGVFWALLYLSAQSKVELEQQEFYRDLKVRSLTGEIAQTPEESLSDLATFALPD